MRRSLPVYSNNRRTDVDHHFAKCQIQILAAGHDVRFVGRSRLRIAGARRRAGLFRGFPVRPPENAELRSRHSLFVGFLTSAAGARVPQFSASQSYARCGRFSLSGFDQHGMWSTSPPTLLWQSFRRQTDASPAHRVHVFAVAVASEPSRRQYKKFCPPNRSYVLVGRVPQLISLTPLAARLHSTVPADDGGVPSPEAWFAAGNHLAVRPCLDRITFCTRSSTNSTASKPSERHVRLTIGIS